MSLTKARRLTRWKAGELGLQAEHVGGGWIHVLDRARVVVRVQGWEATYNRLLAWPNKGNAGEG